MIEEESPAEMSSTVAPSFCACLTLLFINTVQREPKSTGFSANKPRDAKSAISYPRASANVWINEPQPEEHASFSIILSML